MIPTLAVTLGDVAGVGPEITVKMLLRHPELRQQARLVVIGDVAALQKAAQLTGEDPHAVRAISHPAEGTNAPNTIEVIQEGGALDHIPYAVEHPEAGDAAVRFVKSACDWAKKGAVQGIVTPPLNKAAIHLAGHHWPGHTELLAHEFQVPEFSLVLSAGDLYIFHATTHVSMRQAIEDITPARMDTILHLVHSFARALGKPNQPIGVAGLNPHAGENRIFGTEDADIIAPAIARAVARGAHVEGPFPADALLPQAFRGHWQFIVACYHDQGHAAFKSVHGEEGVNITVGLPIVRVSVDHGTAFDIAGQNKAREASLVLAVQRAAHLAPGWKTVWQAMQHTSSINNG